MRYNHYFKMLHRFELKHFSKVFYSMVCVRWQQKEKSRKIQFTSTDHRVKKYIQMYILTFC